MNSICVEESTDTYLLRESYRTALRQQSLIGARAVSWGLPEKSADDFSAFFVESYPDKVVEEDLSLVKAIAETAVKLRVEKQPVLVVSRLPEKYNPSPFGAIVTFGFSAGQPLTFSPGHEWYNRDIKVPLVAPQALSCYGKTSAIVDYTQSFAVSEWGVASMQHVGSYLFRRSYENAVEVEPEDQGDEMLALQHRFAPEMWVTYTHKTADIRVGNAEIEAFVEDNPSFAEVVDGCRSAYRNQGMNPLIGRTIAKDFKLDITDEEARKLRWL